MRKTLLVLAVIWTSISHAQKTEESPIRNLLSRQTEAWNRGDIDGFMQTYWQSDSLMFIGREGITWGWQNTLERYKKSYPGKEAMGRLSFEIVQIKKLSKEYFFVVGKWMLKRNAGDLSGHYNLLIKRINGEWKIITDHSS
jgi:ketosteroid isomerase-like protein